MTEEKSFVESPAEMFKLLREENRETKRDLNKRIDDIDKKIDSVIAENRETKRDLNKRMDDIDKRMDRIENRMDKLEDKFDKLNEKLDKGFKDLDAKFDDFRKDIFQQFKENRSEGLSFNRQGQVLTGSIVAAIAAVIYSILK